MNHYKHYVIPKYTTSVTYVEHSEVINFKNRGSNIYKSSSVHKSIVYQMIKSRHVPDFMPIHTHKVCPRDFETRVLA